MKKLFRVLSVILVLTLAFPTLVLAGENIQQSSDLVGAEEKDFKNLIVEIQQFKEEHPEYSEEMIKDFLDEHHQTMKRGIADIWNALTETEKKLCIRYPFDALKVNKAKNIATSQTEAKFGTNGLGNRSDAFRHGIWNAEMTVLIGKESFEVRPFQFLVKPVTDKIMEKCFKSVYEDINSEDFYFRYSYQRMNHKVPIKDILYFESNKRKIFIVTEQEILELYGKLNEIEETLKTCKISFLRVHQSFLVNYKHISGQSYDSVVMDNGQKISISEDRRKTISEQYCSMEDTFYVDE